MKNIKNLIFILLIVIFTGCSLKPIKNVAKKDPIYAQNLQYTKVAKLIDKDIVTTIINVTYLNSVDKKVWSKGLQNFIVGIYFTENKDVKYEMFLNGKKPIKIEPILKDNILYKNIAFKNKWAKYYLVRFNDIKKDKLNFTYKEQNKKDTIIVFDKEY